MSLEDAQRLLGVSSSASFEEVLQAKNRKITQAEGSMEQVMEIEAAYDQLFMNSMKRRLSGEVPTSVRYADVQQNKPRKQAPQRAGGFAASSSGSRSAAASAAQEGLLSLALPTSPQQQQQASVAGGVYAALAVWSALQVVFESPEAQLADTAGLQMALGLGYAVYALREQKKIGLGKAIGVGMACLFAGALFGTALQSWLRVDIVPLGNFGSPGVFVTEFVLLFVALGAVCVV